MYENWTLVMSSRHAGNINTEAADKQGQYSLPHHQPGHQSVQQRSLSHCGHQRWAPHPVQRPRQTPMASYWACDAEHGSLPHAGHIDMVTDNALHHTHCSICQHSMQGVVCLDQTQSPHKCPMA